MTGAPHVTGSGAPSAAAAAADTASVEMRQELVDSLVKSGFSFQDSTAAVEAVGVGAAAEAAAAAAAANAAAATGWSRDGPGGAALRWRPAALSGLAVPDPASGAAAQPVPTRWASSRAELS